MQWKVMEIVHIVHDAAQGTGFVSDFSGKEKGGCGAVAFLIYCCLNTRFGSLTSKIASQAMAPKVTAERPSRLSFSISLKLC